MNINHLVAHDIGRLLNALRFACFALVFSKFFLTRNLLKDFHKIRINLLFFPIFIKYFTTLKESHNQGKERKCPVLVILIIIITETKAVTFRQQVCLFFLVHT